MTSREDALTEIWYDTPNLNSGLSKMAQLSGIHYTFCYQWKLVWLIGSLPSNGLSEVTGIVSDTVLRNTVNDRRIVTPEKIKIKKQIT